MVSIDLRLLRHAQALAEHGSFSRAAEALDIAQPSLSRGIKELETRVGLPLFNRSRSGHEPTDFGRVFLQHAAAVLAEVGDLEREVAFAKGLGTGELSVGMGPYVAEVLGPICAARFAAAHPGVRLRTVMNDPATVARLLRARTVDLAIAEASVLEDDDAFEVIAELTPLAGYVVVRAGHPLAGRTSLELEEILDYPFAQVVMLPPRVLKPILAARRPPSVHGGTAASAFPAIECPTIHFATRIVADANANAFTFATLGMVRAELERGQIVPLLEAPWIRGEWNIVHLRKRTTSPAMDAFVEGVKQAHAEVLREEVVLRERWFASPDGPSQSKHATQQSHTKPREVAHPPFADKRR
jgi:DNA-binding transcriptional LysR family regulator